MVLIWKQANDTGVQRRRREGAQPPPRPSDCNAGLDRLQRSIVAGSGRQTFQLTDEAIQERQLRLQVQGGAASDRLSPKLTVLRFLPARDVQPARLRKVKSPVERTVGVFGPELPEPDVDETTVKVLSKRV